MKKKMKKNKSACKLYGGPEPWIYGRKMLNNGNVRNKVDYGSEI